MGRPGYEVLGGEVLLDGRELRPARARARAAGLFLAMRTQRCGRRRGDADRALVATPCKGASTPSWPRSGKIGFDERFLDYRST